MGDIGGRRWTGKWCNYILIPDSNLTGQVKGGMYIKALNSKGFVSQMFVDKPSLSDGSLLPTLTNTIQIKRKIIFFPQRIKHFSSNELDFPKSD